MGSIEQGGYSVPEEAKKLLLEGVLSNKLVPSLPSEVKEASKLLYFTGNDTPSIPINWRFAESVSALKGLEAVLLNVLRAKKYGSKLSKVTIDTDHASLFVMSPFLAQVVGEDGRTTPLNVFGPGMEKYGFPSTDLHRASASQHRVLATNIYRTKDGRYYHCHGSMNPEPTLTALNLPLEGAKDESYDSVVENIQSVVAQHESADPDRLMNEQYKQAGTIAWTPEEFKASEHGKANAHIGLYDLVKAEKYNQAASWWPENASLPSSSKRPLAGLKVVDLTRVIASPAIGRSLAEAGASVMRVSSSTVTDMSTLHQDLNW